MDIKYARALDETESNNHVIVPPPHFIQWMPKPEPIAGCPPGLEYLTQLDQLILHQQVEVFEAVAGVAGIQTENRYAIKNSVGQQCYFAYEESDMCMRLCCKNARGFEMHVVNNQGQEVMRAYRDFRCCIGCCWCINGDTCAFIVPVESPTGVPIGRIVQLWSSWKRRFAIQNVNLETLLVIQAPCCVWSGVCCPEDTAFDIFTADQSQCIGRIARQYSGVAKEMLTNATNFSLNFPMDLDVRAKALVLASTFLIDLMYFERN